MTEPDLLTELGPETVPVHPSGDGPDSVLTPPVTGWRAHRFPIAVSGLVLGAIVAWLGIAEPVALPAPRAAVAILGILLLVAGIDSALKARFGEQVQTSAVLGTVWLTLLVIASVFADLLPLAESLDTSKTLQEPSLLRPDLFSAHPLGTDRQGLDVLGGILYGARVSLVVGIGAVLIGLVVGGTLGMLAGYYRRRVEAVINLGSDALIAFPPLVLLLALVAVLEPSVRNVTLGLAILGIPVYIRLARAYTLRIVQSDFVKMARALGARDRRILLREVVPNLAAPLISYGFVVIAVLIVAEASLSYLGLSVQRPAPTWGNLIAAGESTAERNPHLVFAPGAVLFITVFALNAVGEAARRRWELR